MGRQDKDPLEVLGSALLPRKYRKFAAIANAVKALAKKHRAEPQAAPAPAGESVQAAALPHGGTPDPAAPDQPGSAR